MRRAVPPISPARPVLQRLFRPIPGLSTVPAGGAGLLLRAPGGHCVSLGAVASRVWMLLERGASLRTIRGVMLREYGVPPGWLEAELGPLLESLVRAGILERTG